MTYGHTPTTTPTPQPQLSNINDRYVKFSRKYISGFAVSNASLQIVPFGFFTVETSRVLT